MNETIDLFATHKNKSRVCKREHLFATIKHIPTQYQPFSSSTCKVSSLASFKQDKAEISVIGQNKIIRKLFTEEPQPLRAWNISNIKDFKREIEMLDCESFNTSLRLKQLQKKPSKIYHNQAFFNENKRQKTISNIKKKCQSKIGIRRNSETIEKKALGYLYKENIRPHTKIPGSRKLMNMLVNKLQQDLFKNCKRAFNQQKFKRTLKQLL